MYFYQVIFFTQRLFVVHIVFICNIQGKNIFLYASVNLVCCEAAEDDFGCGV